MTSVLFGWELGAGHGHVRTLLPVARELASRGFQPHFAVRYVAETWPVLRDSGFPVLQAPFWREPARRPGAPPFASRTFGDILAWYGWTDPEILEGMVRAWDALLDRVRPALVVLDHAPSLGLATYGRVPVLQLGTGFSVAPAHLPDYPVVNPDATALAPASALLESIAEVQRRRGQPTPAALPATVSHGERLLTIFPELDPYASVRCDRAVGPVAPPPPPLAPPLSPRWFAYLNAETPGIAEIALDLAAGGLPGEAYIRGAAPELRAKLSKAGVLAHAAPAPMNDVLARCSVLVHNGGMGTTSAALAAGRPQVLVPQWNEQRLTAAILARMGVGLSTAGGESPGALLHRISRGELFAAEARDRARAIEKNGPWRALPLIVERCEALLKG